MSNAISLRRAEARTAARADLGADTDRQIARINALTRAGRGNWFGLLAYLAFTLVTVLGVSDADFFIDSRQTQLPLIGVSIPTFDFFTFAPILGAALHVYLHLLIRKSTEALAEPAPMIRGRPLEHALHPWLLNDLVLRMRRDGATIRRPLDWLAGVTAMQLIWVAAPYVIALMWVRSLPAHDEGLSLLIALCLGFTIYASLQSWVKMRNDLHRPWLGGGLVSLLVFAAAFLIWAALSALTVLSTEGGLDRLTGAQRPGWTAWPGIAPALAAFDRAALPGWARDDRFLARADLRGVVFASLPPDQSNRAMAKSNFRQGWCARNGMDVNICGPADDTPDHLYITRSYWCQSNGLPSLDDCRRRFSDLEAGFDREWTEFRRAQINALERPDLRGRNLVQADMVGAQLPGVGLDGAQMQRVNLGLAHLERAFLRRAQLSGANLSDTRMEGANLRGAILENVDLHGAQMRGAVLDRAQMQGATLRGAQMQEARFVGTQLQEADLRLVRMEGAYIMGAQMQGAVLSGAQMQGVVLNEVEFDAATVFDPATMLGAMLKTVDLSMLDLAPGILAEAYGDGTVVLPVGLAAGKPPLEHWSTEDLDYHDIGGESSPFNIAWRAWQSEIGYDATAP